jgi:branched-chain amino acid transport system substrate-binding protein
MKTTLRRAVLAFVLALPLALAACGGDDEEATPPAETGGAVEQVECDEPFTVGGALGLTGFITPWDLSSWNMAKLKIDEINEAGGLLGCQIETVESDTKSDINLGAVAAKEVLEQGANFVMVTCDYDFGGPAAREANAQGIIAFSPCAASPKFGAQGIGPYAFTMATGTPGQGAILAEWAYEQGHRSAYVLLDETVEYDRTLCGYFKERWSQLDGATIAGEDTFKNPDPSISSQITRLKGLSEQPDFIFYCSYPPGGASALKQIRDAGIDLPVVTGESMDGDFWLEAVPNLSNFYNATYGSLFGDDPDPNVNELFDRYEETYGERPLLSHALTGYSVIEALELAAERAGSLEPEALKAALESFQDEPLITGATTFTPELHMNISREMRIMETQDGQPAYLETFTPEQVPEVDFS